MSGPWAEGVMIALSIVMIVALMASAWAKDRRG